MDGSEREAEIPETTRQDDEAPCEVMGAPDELPAAEERRYGFRLAVPAEFEASAEAVKVAEFWLNVSDGDALLALVRACERMTTIVDRESYGFRRGRSLVTPTGLPKDERLL